MDTGPSLDTIDQNATNDQSGLESNDHVIMKQDHLLKDYTHLWMCIINYNNTY